MIGVRKNFGGEPRRARPPRSTSCSPPRGRRLARPGVGWSLVKVERRYQWFSAGGRWGYEPILTKRRVADGRIDLASGDPARIAVPVQWGQYRLEVSAPDLGGTAHTRSPSRSGGRANRRRRPPTSSTWRWTRRATAPGSAWTCASRRGLPARRPSLSSATGSTRSAPWISPRRDECQPRGPSRMGCRRLCGGARTPALDQAARRQPGRALGVAWFAVDRGARALQVELAAPAQIRPRGTLKLPIQSRA